MNAPVTNPFVMIASVVKKHAMLLIVPTVLCTVLAGGYAFTRPDKFRASQGLIVRNDASRQGRFDDSSERKAAQETILEVSRNTSVARAAWVEAAAAAPQVFQAGPEGPSPAQAEQLRSSVSVTAPKGKELGETELIYLNVNAESPQRALALNRAVANQLEKLLKQIRNERATSLTVELEKALSLAQDGLDRATNRVRKIEASVGSDLPELAILQSGNGHSNLLDAQTDLEQALRAAKSARLASLEQRKHIAAAMENPQLQVNMPPQVLNKHEKLRKLSDALVAAQLQTFERMGTMQAAHPKVQAALEEENLVRAKLHSELNAALRTLETELQLNAAAVEATQNQLQDITARLNRLAGLRADYRNALEDVRQQAQNVDTAQSELGKARANQVAAQAASLINRLDAPVVGSSPIGPSRATLILVGLAGGLVIGTGLVLLMSPLGGLSGRRWTDYLGGRRSGDSLVQQQSGPLKDRRGVDDTPRNAATLVPDSEPEAAVAETAKPTKTAVEVSVSETLTDTMVAAAAPQSPTAPTAYDSPPVSQSATSEELYAAFKIGASKSSSGSPQPQGNAPTPRPPHVDRPDAGADERSRSLAESLHRLERLVDQG